MKADVIHRHPLTSVLILAIGFVSYTVLCWPAMTRRGYPEISPFWLAMPFLWIAPIIFSAACDSKSRLRKWSVGLYALCSAFVCSGAGMLMMFVPHRLNASIMLIETVLFLGPIHLLIAWGVEKLSQFGWKFLRAFPLLGVENNNRFPVRVAVASVILLATTAAFPFVYRSFEFAHARNSAVSDAARYWKATNAIWYLRRGEKVFGADGGGTYCLSNGLRTKVMMGGVTKTLYYEAYRERIEKKLAEFGPTDKVKELFTIEEIQKLIQEGRFQQTKTFPIQYGDALITPDGYRTENGMRQSSEPSRFVYQTIIPEKKNTLIVITDGEIWIFASGGELLQEIDSQWYDPETISEQLRNAHHKNPPTSDQHKGPY